jgi:excinuclease ABC subunit B
VTSQWLRQYLRQGCRFTGSGYRVPDETSLNSVVAIGRAARNAEGKVILYADKITNSMQKAMSETERRRKIQHEYNQAHGITPKTVYKNIRKWDHQAEKESAPIEKSAADQALAILDELEENDLKNLKSVRTAIQKWSKQMLEAAKNREFEQAAILRDKIKVLKQLELKLLGEE